MGDESRGIPILEMGEELPRINMVMVEFPGIVINDGAALETFGTPSLSLSLSHYNTCTHAHTHTRTHAHTHTRTHAHTHTNHMIRYYN